MATDVKMYEKDLYDSALISVGVVGISFVLKKALSKKFKLVSQESLEDTAKLTLAVMLSTMGVRYIKKKKWLPENPFSK